MKKKSLDRPDETRPIDKGTVEVVELHVVMEGGDELDLGPGDAMQIPPGHDAWVVGDEPYVGVDFRGGAKYAKA